MGRKMIYLDDAINAIKAGAFGAATLFGRTDEGMTALSETVRLIKDLPSAQPEIIRCRDCAKYKTVYCAMDVWMSDMKIYTAKPDDFCSRAERGQDEQI